MTTEKLKETLITLIKAFGVDEELRIFQYCSDKGLELDGSTIDKISIIGNNNLAFYYNENTNDFDTFGVFASQCPLALQTFLYKLMDILKQESGCTMMNEEEYRKMVTESFEFGDSVTCDVLTTGEWEGNSIIEHRNDCGCLLSRYNLDKGLCKTF